MSRSTKPGPNIERVAEAIAYLVKKPRSISELCEVMGLAKACDSVYRYVYALRAEGLVYIHHWEHYKTISFAVYAWQPSPSLIEDAPRPEPTWPPKKKRAMQGVLA